MLIRCIADALNSLAFFGERGRLGYGVAETGLVKGVAVKLRQILGNASAFCAVPRAAPDAIPGVDGGFAIGCLGAQVGVPCPIARASGGCEHLAVLVGSGQSTEIAAFTATD